MVAQCNSIADVTAVTSVADQVQQLLQASIDQFQSIAGPEPPAKPLPIGLQRDGLSPASSEDVSAEDEFVKVTCIGQTTQEETRTVYTRKRSQPRSARKAETAGSSVVPLCFLCDDEYDSRDVLAEKCSNCGRWYHMSCHHVCIM